MAPEHLRAFLQEIQAIDRDIERMKSVRAFKVTTEAKRRGGKYLSVEAFFLMQYECENCGKLEKIWNSRDGVAPFIVSCRQCDDGSMRHVNWSEDVLVLDYVPQRGSRVFIDATPEMFKLTLRALVDKNWNHPVYAMRGSFKSKTDAIDILSGELKTGDPYVLTL